MLRSPKLLNNRAPKSRWELRLIAMLQIQSWGTV